MEKGREEDSQDSIFASFLLSSSLRVMRRLCGDADRAMIPFSLSTKNGHALMNAERGTMKGVKAVLYLTCNYAMMFSARKGASCWGEMPWAPPLGVMT